MTRATIDFYDDGHVAAKNAASLCGVGLKPSDVAAIWSLASTSSEAGSVGPGGRRVDLAGVGPIGLTGWIVGELGQTDHRPWSISDLEHALRFANPSQDTLRRVLETLTSGGGMVVVRSTEAATSF